MRAPSASPRAAASAAERVTYYDDGFAFTRPRHWRYDTGRRDGL